MVDSVIARMKADPMDDDNEEEQTSESVEVDSEMDSESEDEVCHEPSWFYLIEEFNMLGLYKEFKFLYNPMYIDDIIHQIKCFMYIIRKCKGNSENVLLDKLLW